MKEVPVLHRCLSGKNEIIKGIVLNHSPGVERFDKFLKGLGLYSHEFALELGQVLKIPCEQIIKLGESKGFITGDAKNNVLAYLQVRIPPGSIGFLQSQQGEAGINNDEKD